MMGTHYPSGYPGGADTPPEPPRKIIQIAVCPSDEGDPFYYVLCDDGTHWMLQTSGTWVQMPPIPQP
jgi:hypothetical protein